MFPGIPIKCARYRTSSTWISSSAIIRSTSIAAYGQLSTMRAIASDTVPIRDRLPSFRSSFSRLKYAKQIRQEILTDAWCLFVGESLFSLFFNLLHVENLSSQNCNTVSVLSMFKCNPGETNDKFRSSDIVPTSLKETESDELLHAVRSLVMVREP